MKQERIPHTKGCKQANSTCPLNNKFCAYENVKGFCNFDCNCAIAFRQHGLSYTRYHIPHLREDLLIDHRVGE